MARSEWLDGRVLQTASYGVYVRVTTARAMAVGLVHSSELQGAPQVGDSLKVRASWSRMHSLLHGLLHFFDRFVQYFIASLLHYFITLLD